MTDSNNNTETKLSEKEQELLDTALLESDQLLARSLQDDQRRRRGRKIWLSVFFIGVVAMSLFIVALMSGWLVFSGPSPVEARETSVEEIEKAESLAAQGWQLWQARQFSEAIPKFEQSVEIDPDAANAWNGLGWARFNSGQSEKAVAAFEKCVALSPRHGAGLNGLGQIYLLWKDYDKAEEYLALAAPTAPAAQYGLTRVLLLQGRFKEAKRWANKVAAASPQDQVAQQMLAAAKTGKLDDDLRKMIEPAGKPKKGGGDAAKGWQMFQQGKLRTAERLFQRALKKDKDNLAALNGLAFCYLNEGKHQKAKPLFEKYLKKEKDAAGPMNGLARCLKAEGKVDEAIVVWERMAKKYPGPTAAAAGLASTYLEKQEYAKSVKYFEILVKADPRNQFYQDGLKKAQAGLAEAG